MAKTSHDVKLGVGAAAALVILPLASSAIVCGVGQVIQQSDKSQSQEVIPQQNKP
jgi:hypothetical protein